VNKIFGSRSFVSFFVLFLVVFATIIFIWLIFPKEPAPVSLRILGDSFSGYSTFRDSEFQKSLQQSQIGLIYEDEFDQQKRAQQLKLQKADLIVTTLDQFIKQNTYSSGKIVGLIGRSNGADAVVLNTKKYPNLKSLADLRQFIKTEKAQGRKPSITLAEDTPSEFLALGLTTKEDFRLSDFKIINKIDAQEVWQDLNKSQDIPIAVLWEPYVTQARNQGYSVVFSSKDETTAIIEVIVSSNYAIKFKSDAISKFLVAYYNHIHERIFDPSLLEQQISADDKNLSPADAKAIREGIQFLTLLQSYDWLTSKKLEEKIRAISSLLFLVGKISQKPQNPQDFFTAQPIAKTVEDTKESCNTERVKNIERIRLICNLPSILQVKDEPKIGEVRFSEGSSKITDEGKKTLDELAKTIKDYDPKTTAVRVTGHASGSQGSNLNDKISNERAKVVGQYLSDRLKEYQVEAISRSIWYPLSKVPPEDPRQSRAEIRLIPRQ